MNSPTDSDAEDFMWNGTMSIFVGTSVLLNLLLFVCVLCQCAMLCGRPYPLSPTASGVDEEQAPLRRARTTTPPIFRHSGIQTDPELRSASIIVISADGMDIEYGAG